MIVGGYSLDLYCSKSAYGDSSREHAYKADSANFGGNNERHARSKARKAGWVFRNGDVICPACVAPSAADEKEGASG